MPHGMQTVVAGVQWRSGDMESKPLRLSCSTNWRNSRKVTGFLLLYVVFTSDRYVRNRLFGLAFFLYPITLSLNAETSLVYGFLTNMNLKYESYSFSASSLSRNFNRVRLHSFQNFLVWMRTCPMLCAEEHWSLLPDADIASVLNQLVLPTLGTSQ